MKLKFRSSLCAIPLPTAISTTMVCFAACIGSLSAETRVWTAGATGKLEDNTKYDGNVAPVTDDIVTSDGTGSIIGFDAASTITLDALRLNEASGATIFNQSGGTLTVGTLRLSGSSGASRNPTYNLTAGILNASVFSWGAGSNMNFNVEGGTMNYGGSAITIGSVNLSNGKLNVSAGLFDHTGTGQVQLGTTNGGTGNINISGGTFSTASTEFRIGSQSGGTGNITLSGNGILNALADTGTRNIYLGNNGGNGTLTMGGTSQFNAVNHVLSVGQFSNTAGRTGEVTMNGGTLNVLRIAVGGDNAASVVTGIINLNGGTIATGAIRKGSSSVVASSTANVLRGNGGTLKVVANGFNSDFLQGTFIDLQAGGLNFDTDGNDAGISNNMSGVGGFTKKGAGTLTFTGTNTYEGLTTVETGTLVNNGEIAGAVTVGADATLGGNGGTIVGATTINGTFAIGSSPGLMNFTGGLTLNGTAIFELGGTAVAGTDYDHANVTGTLNFGGALNIISHNSHDLATNAAYNLFDSVDAPSGTFASVSVGGFDLDYDLDSDSWSGTTLGGTSYSFNEGDGVLTVVPEPASALLGSLGLLALFRRRRIS